MKTIFRKVLAILISVIILCGAFLSVGVVATSGAQDVTVLFTHDLHSHLLPSADTDGSTYGGYARLSTAIAEQKKLHPNALLLDGGDFAMGSLFQTAFATSAIELRMMGQMGYDVTTFGNHEFDYLQSGLASMLNSAKRSGDALPQIVCANYKPTKNDKDLYDAYKNYGVKDYTILERGGVYFAVFGIFGADSHDCAPNSGLELLDPIKTAQKTVDKAVKDCLKTYGKEPVVICLSHSGTQDGEQEGEDVDLAKGVEGIDLIISGHTHSVLKKPITVGETYIVSAGEYAKYLGVANFEIEGEKTKLKDYKLVKIDQTLAEDKVKAKQIERFKKTVENDYLKEYSLTFDEILTHNPYIFDTVEQVYATQHESTLGNLFADAYKWAAEGTLGEDVDVSLTASGVIRESIKKGDVTVSDVFNAASLGVGTEGELVKVYVTGKDLLNALEVDASVQPIMAEAQLFFSGVEYSFNTYRMIFNKVDYARLRTADGKLEEIDQDKLYCVVAGMYVGQMLGAVKDKSFGLLNITPRDKDGNPISADELVNYVIKDKDGTPIKEWYAIASYIQQMGGEMDAKYSKTDSRKVVYSSINPIDLLKNINVFTIVAIILVNLLIFAIVMIIRKIVKRKNKKKNKNK